MVDSLVPTILSVQYQCYYAVVGNIVVDITGPRIISVQYQCLNAAAGNMKLTSLGRYLYQWLIR